MEQITSKPFVYHNRDSLDEAFQCLAEFRDNGLLCDVLLCVENREIPAHRVILAASSPYFKAMFLGNLSESKQHRVALYEIDASAIEMLVEFIYTGVLKIEKCNVHSLLYASAVLQFEKVRKACCEFLLRALNIYNCLGIRSLAETLSCHELFATAHQFVVDHFGDVAKHDEFLKQPFESLKCLLDSRFLNASSEDEVFSGVLKWLNFSPVKRRTFASSLINQCCLMKISPDFLRRILRDSIVEASCECRKLISKALETVQSSNLQDVYEFPGISHRSLRTGHEVMLAIGGESDGMTLDSCQCFNPKCNSWTWEISGRCGDPMPLANINDGRTFMGVTSSGHHTYVVGGHSSWNILDSVEHYEWPGNKWCHLSPLRMERMGASAVLLDAHPVILGGYNRTSGYLSSVEMYDPLIDKWTLVSSMRSRRSYLGAVAIGKTVYVIGGFGGESGNLSNDWLMSVEKLDSQSGEWLSVTIMSQPRAYFGAVQKEGMV